MVNVWFAPSETGTAPLGLIDPLAPALAVMVCGVGSPTWKSLNDVTPVAWVLVAVRVPAVVENQFGELNRRTMKFAVVEPASTSPATKLNVGSYVVNAMPELVRVQKRFTLLA